MIIGNIFPNKKKNSNYLIVNHFFDFGNFKLLNERVKTFRANDNIENSIATITAVASDFQHSNTVCIEEAYKKVAADNHHRQIIRENIIQTSIYLAVRHCIEATWLNDRDQFLRPKDERENDIEFQNDCLAFTLFHSQNKITSNKT